VYAFIKVQNRAGLDRKVWFGPILADETIHVEVYSTQHYVIKFVSDLR
jgi:hypothetical protein